MCKEETRKIAEESGFINAKKPDSQDICFVPDGDYAKVIELHTGKKAVPGNFVDKNGKILGRHKGIIHYTIGQHRWLGIDLPGKRYVCRICPKDNTVMLGTAEELFGSEVFAEDFNWISGEAPVSPLRCMVKIRYRQPEQRATVTPVGENAARIVFDEPQRAITPGQAAVLYDGETVLGGGIIAAEEGGST